MKKSFSKALASFSILTVLAGCSMSVKRIDTNSVTDISDQWNDTDAQLTSQEMISQCTAAPWLAKAQSDEGKNPTVIVGTIRNKSFEHINTDTIVEDIQSSLINSGKVTFVASSTQRADVRGERLDQDVNATEETRKAAGHEAGADFMMQGDINAIKQTEEGKEVMFYQVNLQLINMKDNSIAWIGQKKIKKFIKRSALSL